MPIIWTTGCTLPWFRSPPLQDYHREWDTHGASVRSTKFRVVPYDFSLSLSLNILPVLQMLHVFCFKPLPALSLTHVFHNAATLYRHCYSVPFGSTCDIVWHTHSSQHQQLTWFLCFPLATLTVAMVITVLLTCMASCARLPQFWVHSFFVLWSAATNHWLSPSPWDSQNYWQGHTLWKMQTAHGLKQMRNIS